MKIFGAGIDKTVLQMPIDDSAPSTAMFKANGESGGKLRISGITFKGRPNRDVSDTGDTGIVIESCQDFRVDHSSFWDMGGSGVNVGDSAVTYGTYGGDINQVSQGVIDHCNFHRIYKPKTTAAGKGYGYGVVVGRAWHYLWTVPNLYPDDPWTIFGKYYKNVYIEDCYFSGCRHAVCGNWAGAYVLRYSIIEDQGMYAALTTGHPVRSDVLGMFAQEIYNITVRNRGTYVSKHIGFLVKGGSALMYNNTVIDIQDQAFLVGTYEHYNEEFYPLGNTKETYIWDNEVIGGGDLAILTYLDTPVEGTDFFTDLTGKYTTQQIQSMIDAKGYKPYPYPHPLTLEEPPPPENVTPWEKELVEKTYRITMPQQVLSGTDTYRFVQWEDGSINPTRTINLTADTMITATYELAPPTPPVIPILAPLSVGLILLYVGFT